MTIPKKTPMRAEILNVAADLFYREGIRSVGVDRIIDEANIAKATLYRHFPSKNDLVAAYLDERNERVLRSFKDALEAIESPREQIAAVFRMLFEKADSPDFRGCAFALAVAEHGESERVTSVARQHKAAVRAILGTIMTHAGAASDRAAAHIALLYEGALATVAVDHDPQAVLIAGECALAVFDLAVAGREKTNGQREG